MRFHAALVLIFLSLRLAAQNDTALIATNDVSGKYTASIRQADSCMRARDFRNAKAFYRTASNLKPMEQYPKDQIELCDRQVVCYYPPYFEQAIRAGDSLFRMRNYPEAKRKYQQAAAIKTAEDYPKVQIAECEKRINDRGIDSAYDRSIAEGDSLYGAGLYAEAWSQYAAAVQARSFEKYPKERIEACDSNLRMIQQRKKYDALIAQADSAFTAGNCRRAREFYERAAADPLADEYPQKQIRRCNTLLKED